MDEGHEELVTALKARGVDATVDELSVIVDQTTDDQYDAIRDALVESNAPLRRLAPRRRHLTDIFRDGA